MALNEEQIQRYNRNIIITDVGMEGQQKIAAAKVLVIGSGGLGSAVLLYLTAAGVGTIGIADSDVVDLTNLQRQIIHFTDDVDREKVLSAKEKINKLNPDVKVNTYIQFIDSTNIMKIIEDYDFIVDCTDNFPSKFLINDACVIANKPYSHAGVLRFDGQTITIVPGESACLRCVLPEPPPPGSVPTGSQAGILGAIAGLFGTLQASEALKFIIGKGNLLTNRIMIFDGLQMEFRNMTIEKRKSCPVCGENPRITTLTDY